MSLSASSSPAIVFARVHSPAARCARAAARARPLCSGRSPGGVSRNACSASSAATAAAPRSAAVSAASSSTAATSASGAFAANARCRARASGSSTTSASRTWRLSSYTADARSGWVKRIVPPSRAITPASKAGASASGVIPARSSRDADGVPTVAVSARAVRVSAGNSDRRPRTSSSRASGTGSGLVGSTSAARARAISSA